VKRLRDSRALKILHSIAEAWLGSTFIDDASLKSQVSESGWDRALSRAIEEELGVEITATEVDSADSLVQLSNLLESRLPRNPSGQSLVDVYATVERLAREECHPDIDYHWRAHWSDVFNAGNWLTAPDSLDAVEIIIRMEEEFSFSIPNQDAEAMETVGQTVRYLWRRSCEQDFTLRQFTEGVCRSAFIFYELRRLLLVRGGVPRAEVLLDARLGDLLPSWYLQFWKQIQEIFRVDLPQGSLLSFRSSSKRRLTIKELVSLIASSKG
jgi:acyl carrier protein